MRELRRFYRIEASRGGRRTTFRVNCLYADRAAIPRLNASEHEQCIVPHNWFRQRWGREVFSNTRHVCCDHGDLRSSYNLSTLQVGDVPPRGSPPKAHAGRRMLGVAC